MVLVEHLLSDLSGLAGAIDCHKGSNVAEAFITASFPWLFNYITYNHIIGTIVQVGIFLFFFFEEKCIVSYEVVYLR